MNNTKNTDNSHISSTWSRPLPADEIARQEEVRAGLEPGREVCVRDLGRFTYSGVWDTMHAFYPADPSLLSSVSADSPLSRYVRRDLRGFLYLTLPYTLLADYIVCG